MKAKANKVILSALSIASSPIAATGCSCSIYPNLVGTPTDYSKDENWLIKETNGSKSVDLIFFLPTVGDPEVTGDINPINENMRVNGVDALTRAQHIFNESVNMYVPLTRQISEKKAFEDGIGQKYEKNIYASEVRTDAYAALDYYFSHYNKNKPYILAGVSHGGFIVKIVLAEYMKIHPDYYSRMVATYLFGATINKQYLKDYTHVKTATGELDTGCVIAWNTEAPGAKDENQLIWDSPYNINPLNWKTDDTYADISLNKGTLTTDYKMVEGQADAYIDLNRHALISTTTHDKGWEFVPAEWKIAGDKSLHFWETNLFAGNIKENVKKRIDMWFKK